MNRYIKAMEIGIANENNGISYFNLVSELHGTKDQVFTLEAEHTFCVWFLENYSALNMNYKPNTNLNLIQEFRDFLIENSKGSDYHIRGANMQLYDYLNQKWFLNGNAAKQYLDYKEYKSARRNSLVATIFAIVSIIISAITFGFSYKSDLNAPQPPYEVKVIENNVRANELEKENKELKEDLFKAEMRISVLEEDNLN